MNEQEAEKAASEIVKPMMEFLEWLAENTTKSLDENDDKAFILWTTVIRKYYKCTAEISAQLDNAVD